MRAISHEEFRAKTPEDALDICRLAGQVMVTLQHPGYIQGFCVIHTLDPLNVHIMKIWGSEKVAVAWLQSPSHQAFVDNVKDQTEWPGSWHWEIYVEAA